MTRVHLVIHGRVQGVYFRATTQEEALRLQLDGWVRNRAAGTVEVVAEGPVDRVQKLVEWCNQGPSLARVDQIDRFDADPIGLDGGFHVRPTM